jgi:ubiquinone/menaquinone biosynthesis C-methylase UbiE
MLISAAMITHARRTNDRVSSSPGDAERLPFPDYSFDAVISFF